MLQISFRNDFYPKRCVIRNLKLLQTFFVKIGFNDISLSQEI